MILSTSIDLSKQLMGALFCEKCFDKFLDKN